MSDKTWNGSKSDFILSYDHSVPAAEVVEAAKEYNLSISAGYVYTLRSQSEKNGKTDTVKKPRKTNGTRGRKPKAATQQNGSTSSEATFKKAVARLGTDRARAILDEFENTLRV